MDTAPTTASTGFFDSIGDFFGKAIDKASPLLETGVKYLTTTQQNAQAYALAKEKATTAKATAINPLVWVGLGVGSLVLLGTALIMKRR